MDVLSNSNQDLMKLMIEKQCKQLTELCEQKKQEMFELVSRNIEIIDVDISSEIDKMRLLIRSIEADIASKKQELLAFDLTKSYQDLADAHQQMQNEINVLQQAMQGSQEIKMPASRLEGTKTEVPHPQPTEEVTQPLKIAPTELKEVTAEVEPSVERVAPQPEVPESAETLATLPTETAAPQLEEAETEVPSPQPIEAEALPIAEVAQPLKEVPAELKEEVLKPTAEVEPPVEGVAPQPEIPEQAETLATLPIEKEVSQLEKAETEVSSPQPIEVEALPVAVVAQPLKEAIAELKEEPLKPTAKVEPPAEEVVSQPKVPELAETLATLSPEKEVSQLEKVETEAPALELFEKIAALPTEDLAVRSKEATAILKGEPLKPATVVVPSVEASKPQPEVAKSSPVKPVQASSQNKIEIPSVPKSNTPKPYDPVLDALKKREEAKLREEKESRPVLFFTEKDRNTNKSKFLKAKRVVSRLFNVLFYILLVSMILFIALFGFERDGEPRDFMGFSTMRVASASMYPTLPTDSLLVIQAVDPAELAVGDIISYTDSNQRVVTHRIIEIIEDEAEGSVRFRLRGDANQAPDRTPAESTNILGRVIWHNYPLGRIIFFFQQSSLFILIALCLAKGVVYIRNRKHKKRIA